MKNDPIAFFDSGVGGLTVLKEFMKEFPNENVIFVGDEIHMPYGEKTNDQIIDYTYKISKFLQTKNVKLIVIACNTATAAALPYLEEHFDIPFLGVIEAGSQEAVKVSKNKKIGIIATNSTVKSNSYKDNIKSIEAEIDVHQFAKPNLVSLVENGDYKSTKSKKMVANNLIDVNQTDIDTLVLGCTHFPIIENIIKQELSPNIKVIDPGVELVRKIELFLKRNDLKNETSEMPIYKFYTTSHNSNFKQIGSKWLNIDLDEIYLSEDDLNL
ncbi:glutamate racemase [Lactobacillus sp. S2-2]|uniref:glutamate racemase n=1 Tax=Lactobacillus sp. S2-2 TaxID=2692917 RepID=UPI001F009675|nr:glutamate racemase [Lactobacillus sp. S2-2]MCF6515820.1 glutamate racemase [Lactobacillus sp. S2-2]